jgi:hypothetical protein
LQRDGHNRASRDVGMETNNAGTSLLLRLVAEHEPLEAARILRRMANEIEALWCDVS